MLYRAHSILLSCLVTAGGLGAMLLLGGCSPSPAKVDATEESPAIVAEAPLPDAGTPDAELGQKIGSFHVTYYWMAAQRKKSGEVPLLDRKTCKPIATVTSDFATRLSREGTGKLLDGRTVNVAGSCSCDTSQCYFVVGKNKAWGVGVAERPLAPFRSVAVDSSVVPIGTLLYIEELDGLTMPGHQPWGGFVHDGCVVADDRGGGVDGHQLDLFMGRRAYYEGLKNRHQLKKVTVFDGHGRCERDREKHVQAVHRNSI